MTVGIGTPNSRRTPRARVYKAAETAPPLDPAPCSNGATKTAARSTKTFLGKALIAVVRLLRPIDFNPTSVQDVRAASARTPFVRNAAKSIRLAASTIPAAIFAIYPGLLLAAQPPAFTADTHPPAPGYAVLANWAALPSHPGFSDQQPPNDLFKASVGGAQVDVFYIHPTTLQSTAHWNQDVGDVATNDWTDISVIARQASAFNACCNVYAPRYRQAGPGALFAKDDSGLKAYDLGYQDVKQAFQYYIAHYNHGRPFILASHSQGTLDSYRLIAELIDRTPLQQQFVAAYAIGVGISIGQFGRTYKSIQPCRRAVDIHCIVSWNSFTRTGDVSAYLARSEGRYTSKYGQDGKALLCINPLTFDLDKPHGTADDDLGSLPGEPSHGPLPPLIASAVSADCMNGVLMVEAPTNAAFKLKLLPQGSLHYHDIDLFYENIRANTLKRLDAFFKNKSATTSEVTLRNYHER